jgi:sugar phosphate isomerase/epimerase
MKFACQEGLAPGKTFAEKLERLERYGFEGVELNGGALMTEEGLAERRAALKGSAVRPSTICGGFAAELVHPDPARRRKCVDAIKRLLDISAELGAVGPIAVPIFNHNDRLPDLSPYKTRHALEIELLQTVLREIGEHGQSVGAVMLLEPLNRYESNALKNVAEAAQVARAVGSPGIKVIPDFFHMNIEETNVPATLVENADVIGHIHLADNTRQQPGTGSIDFKSGFAALKKAGYAGYAALECGLSGPADEVLPRCVQYLRECRG